MNDIYGINKMNKIYEVRCVRDIYRIIKRYYDFVPSDFTIAEAPLSIFHHVRKDLQASSKGYLNFEFAYKYADSCSHCYHITYKGSEINMYVLMDKKMSAKMKKRFFMNLYRVYLVSKIYNITKEDNRRLFNFYIIMNPLKRCMPTKKDAILDVVNINGGYTYVNDNNIYIIREEDYNKVIIHEFLHHNTKMHYQDWDTSNISRLKAHFKICQDLLLLPNEAIIETYACVLNTVFYSIETSKTRKTSKTGEDGSSLNENLKKDQEHSLLLAKKIIDKQGGGIWTEKTHSYCYIVFKTILYVYFNVFLKIYKYQNDTEITDFLIRYSSRIFRRVARLNKQKQTLRQTNRLKQTVFRT
uniref:Uncharacterized protein n=1 Tax=viral metagenome TaxID=1070528 RepID=A0A6C0LQD0_9ZZZZ